MRDDCSTDLRRLRSEVDARIDPVVRGARGESFEERCRLYLEALRWPAGVCCPRCAEPTRLLRLESRSKWHCYRCRYQFSVTAGTLFHRSHLPVWKWLVAVHLTLESADGVSANELRRRLGGSYKTAWFAAHRIRAAMRGRGELLLRALVEAESASRRDRVGSGERSGRAVARVAPAGPGAGRGEGVAHLSGPLAGPHLHLSAKYVRAYLDERRWRLAHRGNPHVFRDTILALLGGESLSYVELVAEL